MIHAEDELLQLYSCLKVHTGEEISIRSSDSLKNGNYTFNRFKLFKYNGK